MKHKYLHNLNEMLQKLPYINHPDTRVQFLDGKKLIAVNPEHPPMIFDFEKLEWGEWKELPHGVPMEWKLK